MVLIADLVSDDQDLVARTASRVVQLANARGAEASSRSALKGAAQFLAGPGAHRRYLCAHQRIQDQ